MNRENACGALYHLQFVYVLQKINLVVKFCKGVYGNPSDIIKCSRQKITINVIEVPKSYYVVNICSYVDQGYTSKWRHN